MNSTLSAPALTSPLLTLHEVAQLLAVSRNTVYRMVNRGALAAYRVSRSLRFHRADIDRLREPNLTDHEYGCQKD